MSDETKAVSFEDLLRVYVASAHPSLMDETEVKDAIRAHVAAKDAELRSKIERLDGENDRYISRVSFLNNRAEHAERERDKLKARIEGAPIIWLIRNATTGAIKAHPKPGEAYILEPEERLIYVHAVEVESVEAEEGKEDK